MRVDHFHFFCQDPERTANFFARHFDGEHYETTEMPNWRILRVRIGDIVLAFSPPRGPVVHPAPAPSWGFDHIGITVSDLDSLLGSLREDGAEIVSEPTVSSLGVRVAMVRLPDAIRIELLQPIKQRLSPL
jgi:catechol 2,3-dioxygenase-like lactoylglutathione lyase family enzyme